MLLIDMVGVLTEQLYLTVLDVHCLEALGAAEEWEIGRAIHTYLTSARHKIRGKKGDRKQDRRGHMIKKGRRGWLNDG